MKRPASGEKNARAHPRAGARSARTSRSARTFIVGFPGETEAEFEELLDFLEEAQLDRVGCFAYSPVEGASGERAAGSRCPKREREERRARFMQVQAAISQRRTRAARRRDDGRVLVDEAPGADGAAVGRSPPTRRRSTARCLVKGAAERRRETGSR